MAQELVLTIAEPLIAAMKAAAQRAYPKECCGLIEGFATSTGWQAVMVHETENLADDPRRHFLVDPSAQIALLKHVRGTSHRVIGCFHSHPGGAAEPSATDRAAAKETGEEGFLWLVLGGDPHSGFTLGAYGFDSTAATFRPIALSHTA
jgi:proteasome lid subunit RPN8/RPN11